MVIRPCSEFPNANADLHAGSIFGCSALHGPCEVTDAAPARDETALWSSPLPESETDEERSPVGAIPAVELSAMEQAALEPSSALESAEALEVDRAAPGESGFFACAAESSELDEELPDVVEFEPLDDEPDPGLTEADSFARVASVLQRLAVELAGEGGAARVQHALDGKVPLPPPLAFGLLHWRALLSGEDSSSLPELTLDEWAAGFLAALFGAEPRALRTRIRAEGIAAFGVLDAA